MLIQTQPQELDLISRDGLTLPYPLPVMQDPAMVYLSKQQSPKGRYTQGRVIMTIASWLKTDHRLVNWSAFRQEHNIAIQNRAANLYKPATARKYQAALRGIAINAWALGLMSAEDYQRAVYLPKIKGESAPKERFMNQGELNAIMDVCIADTSASGVRDGAIIALLYINGIRRSGIVDLDMEHYQILEKQGQQLGKLVVHGKGNEDYTAYIMNEAKAVMDDWLALRGSAPGPLFLRIKQTGEIQYTGTRDITQDRFGSSKEDWLDRLSDQAIYNIVKKRCEEAGVENVSPHDFRHTGIGRMWEKNVDGAAIAKTYNHKNINTTYKYDPRKDDAKISASATLHIKWKSRSETA